jgi:hypothetical protein
LVLDWQKVLEREQQKAVVILMGQQRASLRAASLVEPKALDWAWTTGWNWVKAMVQNLAQETGLNLEEPMDELMGSLMAVLWDAELAKESGWVSVWASGVVKVEELVAALVEEFRGFVWG